MGNILRKIKNETTPNVISSNFPSIEPNRQSYPYRFENRLIIFIVDLSQHFDPIFLAIVISWEVHRKPYPILTIF